VAPNRYGYVLWRRNLFFGGILSRASLILKNRNPTITDHAERKARLELYVPLCGYCQSGQIMRHVAKMMHLEPMPVTKNQPENRRRIHTPSGNPKWALPPAQRKMVFEGKRPTELALQIIDDNRYGH
jgi:hypothetical protein